MLDTLSPKYYLHQKLEEDTVRLSAEQMDTIRAQREFVWNALIPRSAVATTLEPWGVHYLHPTKGWKTVGKKRFAIRGVM